MDGKTMYVCSGSDECDEICPYHRQPHDPFGPYGCATCHKEGKCATTGMIVKCVPVDVKEE